MDTKLIPADPCPGTGFIYPYRHTQLFLRPAKLLT